MSFAARLVHTLVIVSPSDEETFDDYGHPEPGTPTTVEVNGLVQPKRTREIALESQGGGVVSDHVIFLAPRTLSANSYIRFEPDTGDRYEITGIRSYDFGRTPHLEVDAKRVVSDEIVAEAS